MDRMITRSNFEKWLDLQPKDNNVLHASVVVLQYLVAIYGGFEALRAYLRFRGIMIDKELQKAYHRYVRH